MSNCCISGLTLCHEDPSTFVLPQWRSSDQTSPSWWYVIYRWLIALFLVSSILSSLIIAPEKWYIYFTNWGFTILTIQSILAAAMVTYCAVFRRNGNKTSTFLQRTYQVYWLLYIVATEMAFVISLTYWGALAGRGVRDNLGVQILAHGMNLVVVVLDIIIVGHCISFLHFLYPLTVGVVFLSFSGVYYACGGENQYGEPFIYSILDWAKPKNTSIVCLIIISAFLVLHLLIYFMIWLRRTAFQRCVQGDENVKHGENIAMNHA